MGLKSLLLSSFCALVLPLAVAAEPSCLSNYSALQSIDDFNFDSNAMITYHLMAENSAGPFISKVRITATFKHNSHELKLRAHFDDAFQGVSLPYNLFAVMVVQNGSVVGWFDFTHECKGPGVGFFPGQGYTLPVLKLEGEGLQNLQFMVWGRL